MASEGRCLAAINGIICRPSSTSVKRAERKKEAEDRKKGKKTKEREDRTKEKTERKRRNKDVKKTKL